MLRASRRGLVDLIIMIILIVFLVGMGVLAFVASDRAKKEERWLADLRKLPEQQRAEIDASRAKLAEVSTLIGFKGEAEYSSPEAIKEAYSRGGETIAAFYRFKNTSGLDDKKTVSSVSASGEGDKLRLSVGNTEQNNKQLWVAEDGFTLQRAIATQDQMIHNLVSDHIPRMKQQHELQRKWRTEAVATAKTASDTGFKTVGDKIYSSRRELEGKNDEAIAQEDTLSTSLRTEVESADKLARGTELRDKERMALAAMRGTEAARARVERDQKQYRDKVDGRMIDDSNDPDGYVFLVDEKSGWLWINIGQMSDVRLEQTFTVYRAEASRVGKQVIAGVRVKEVMRGNIARCRVDTVEKEGVYPRAGDVVLNETFTKRQYVTYCLVGQFGGKHSSMTRREWIDKLTNLGYIIHPNIDLNTDAVLLGANWQDDPIYLDARTKQLNFQTFTERQMFWFLGFSGPDADANR